MDSKEVFNKLLPYQIPHVKSLVRSLQSFGRGADLSDTGTGKTYSAIAICKLLGLKPLIICPKSVIPSWQTVIDYFDCEYYGIANYELFINCRWYESGNDYKTTCSFVDKYEVKEFDGIEDNSLAEILRKSKVTKAEEEKKVYSFKWDLPNDILIIFDEAHRCKNPKTSASTLLRTVSETSTRVLMLSATICDKPGVFKVCGYALGLYPTLRAGRKWMRDAGKNHQNKMQGVWQRIFPDYAARMRIKDLGDMFPDNDVKAEGFDIECAPEIQRVYDEIKDEIEHYQELEDKCMFPLAKLVRARQKIELLKAPEYVKMAREYLEEGKAVSIFVNFTQTLRFIGDELKTECYIFGEQSAKERQDNIDMFNNDVSNIIICNMRSGGLGLSLHDIHGNFPRVSIISMSWSAQDLIQALGRIHRANGKTKVVQRIVYCLKTVEDDISKIIVEKITNIGCLNDGDTLSYDIKGLLINRVEEGEEVEGLELEFQRLETLTMMKDRLTLELAEVESKIVECQRKIRESIE